MIACSCGSYLLISTVHHCCLEHYSLVHVCSVVAPSYRSTKNVTFGNSACVVVLLFLLSMLLKRVFLFVLKQAREGVLVRREQQAHLDGGKSHCHSMQENQHAMDLIAKLDLEKAQLQRLRDSSSSSIAAVGKNVSPGKSLYKAFGQGKDSTLVADLQNQLELEKAQRQQVQCFICMAACIAPVNGCLC